jgi:hypothetical protein
MAGDYRVRAGGFKFIALGRVGTIDKELTGNGAGGFFLPVDVYKH